MRYRNVVALETVVDIYLPVAVGHMLKASSLRSRRFFCACALVRPQRQPPSRREHSDPSDRSRSPADFLVLRQQSPQPEQYSPVVVARTHQRQVLRTRIRHVRPDIRKIFKQPESEKLRTDNHAITTEISRISHPRANIIVEKSHSGKRNRQFRVSGRDFRTSDETVQRAFQASCFCIAASASYAAPISGAPSLSTTETVIFASKFSKCHLSLNARKKVPSLIFSMIFTAIPPAT